MAIPGIVMAVRSMVFIFIFKEVMSKAQDTNMTNGGCNATSCQNDGYCNVSELVCECQDGFDGPMCQYVTCNGVVFVEDNISVVSQKYPSKYPFYRQCTYTVHTTPDNLLQTVGMSQDFGRLQFSVKTCLKQYERTQVVRLTAVYKYYYNISTGLDICKVAEAVRVATCNMKLQDITIDYLQEICLAVQGVQPHKLGPLSTLFRDWLAICKNEKRREVELDLLIYSVIKRLLINEEGLSEDVDFAVGLDNGTERRFDMCNKSNSVQCDVELRLHPKNISYSKRFFEHATKVLMISENKLSHYGMDMAYPQMACQFSATAKDARFITDDHFVLYNISACGTDSTLLSRAHICKEMVKRASQCLFEEPEFGNSYLFYYPLNYPTDILMDFQKQKLFCVLPIVTFYMAIKGLYLMHQESD
ncbi:uncharacterized protein LOC144439985 [Glandiceps talaboti]